MTETVRPCMECREIRGRASGCQCSGYVCSQCCDCGAAQRELIVQVDKPFSVKEMIDKARAAGHDALGIANDPEAIAALEAVKAKRVHEPVNHHTREPHQPTFAVVVEGDIPFFENGDLVRKIDYQVRLDRNAPGSVEFTLTVDGRICGKLPFDNLVKAATRIDPDHATGPEKQIRALRREAADALAKMYDWQARAGQLEEKVHALEAALEAVRHARP